MFSIQKIHQEITTQLIPVVGLISASTHAWWILEFVLNEKKATLLFSDQILAKSEITQIDTILHEFIVLQKPLQYILKKMPFFNLELFVEEPMLIPRPETEEWVMWLCQKLTLYKNEKLSILDIGTGSGCIALTLAKFLPHADVIALDISHKALALAKKNAAHNNIKNITFLKSDLFLNIENSTVFDIIISNPPYISLEEAALIPASVKNWEDPGALFCGDQGLEIIKNIITQAGQFLKRNNNNFPSLCIEIGHTHGDIVQRLMEKAGFNKVTIFKDMFKKDRMVFGYF